MSSDEWDPPSFYEVGQIFRGKDTHPVSLKWVRSLAERHSPSFIEVGQVFGGKGSNKFY